MVQIVATRSEQDLKEFQTWLVDYLKKWNRNEDKRDQATKVANNLIDLKDHILESQQTLMKRGEKLDLLKEKSEKLKVEAKVYKVRAKQVKKTMWWSKYKLYLILGGIALVLILLLVLWISGALDSNPKKKTAAFIFGIYGQETTEKATFLKS